MNPADLGKIFEMNPGAFHQAQGMLRQNSQGVDLENQRKAAELSQLMEMNPLKLQQQRLQNRGFELGNIMDEERLPGVRADAQGRARDWEVRRNIPIEQELQAKLGELATKMSEDEWKQTEAGIKKLMVSPSAEERRIGELLYKHMPKMVERRIGELLYKHMPKMVEQRENLASREEIARMRAEQEKARQDAITEREAEKERRKKADKESLDNMFEQIHKKTTASGKMAQIRTYLGMLPNDDPRRMAILRMEAELLPQYNAEVKQRTAGKQVFNTETGRFEEPKGVTLEPRNPEADKPDPLGIR